MPKLRTVLDTQKRNYRFTMWPQTVLEPFEEVATIVENARQRAADIDADGRLSVEGKRAAKTEMASTILEAIQKWHMPRLTGLDADLNRHRTALLPAKTETPDARRVDVLLSHLRALTPQEIAVAYNSATPDEQMLMEHASASVGRVPLKTSQGLVSFPVKLTVLLETAPLMMASAET
ncbi:MAG: hypothetical protein QM736_15135 [Vicinamibacterales bacterium]